MACPCFIPAEVHPRELWPHRERLPLGDGFAGCCGAHAPDTQCDDETLRQQCNLGYARCSHLPAERLFDAVRFLVQAESAGSESGVLLRVRFTGERGHLPAMSGELRYDSSSRMWLDEPERRLLHLANAAVRAWMARHAGR